MTSIHRAYSRALITTAAAGTAMSIALLSGAGPAWAHVHVEADDAAPGSTSVLTFRVPGESESGALTTEFSVDPAQRGIRPHRGHAGVDGKAGP